MIYIIADTHGDFSSFSKKQIRHLGEGDHLIIAGDFGFLWDNNEREHKLIKKIGMKKHTTIFIQGDNDRAELYRELPEGEVCGGRMKNLFGNLWLACPGVFEIEGHKLLLCGQPDGSEEEQFISALLSSEEIKNTSFDGIVTYEPPVSVGEFLMGEYDTGDQGYIFERAKQELDFKCWYFGKLHQNKIITSKYCAVFDEPQLIDR